MMLMDCRGFFLHPPIQKLTPMLALERRSDVEHAAGAFKRPAHAAAFHAILHQVTTRAFDDSRRDRIAATQVFIIAHPIRVLLEVATDPSQIAQRFTDSDFNPSRRSIMREMARVVHFAKKVAK